jgi:GDP-4-dehydro-6-deoxy-D-mannose reductase
VRVLLTGSSGFVGSAVQRELACIPLALGAEAVDLRDVEKVEVAIRNICPEAVIHLAAQSFVPQSFQDPLETFQINFLGTFHLLQALKKCEFHGKFLFVGSADVYGAVCPELLPIKEDVPLRPRSPYGVSKTAAEALCIQWSQTEGMEVIVARPFNHIGAGQSERFVVSSLAKQIALTKCHGKTAVFEVGDLSVTRDFTDVRDVVCAYVSLLAQGENGQVYNICSGVERSISSVLTRLLELAGVEAEIRHDHGRIRATEQKRLVGCAEKLRRQTGWEPKIPFDESLKSVLRHWEAAL